MMLEPGNKEMRRRFNETVELGKKKHAEEEGEDEESEDSSSSDEEDR